MMIESPRWFHLRGDQQTPLAVLTVYSKYISKDVVLEGRSPEELISQIVDSNAIVHRTTQIDLIHHARDMFYRGAPRVKVVLVYTECFNGDRYLVAY